MKKNCIHCAAAFYASPGHDAIGWGRFCSHDCYSKHRKGVYLSSLNDSNSSVCPNCDTLFPIKPFAKKEGKGRVFCCKKCRKDYTNVDTTCPQCHQTRTMPQSTARGRTDVFCSMRCLSIWKKEHSIMVSRVCKTCGGAFSSKPSDVNGPKKAGIYCSMACKALAMSKSGESSLGVGRHSGKHRGMFGGRAVKSKGGKRSDLGNVYFRSAWEANYARYLNWLQKNGEIDSWTFEKDTFDFPVRRGGRFYTPDFKVFKSGAHHYVEVKGWMDPKSKTKLQRMAKYFPNERVDVVGYKEMRAIWKAVRFFVNWEGVMK